jgi:hypothetical protein
MNDITCLAKLELEQVRNEIVKAVRRGEDQTSLKALLDVESIKKRAFVAAYLDSVAKK